MFVPVGRLVPMMDPTILPLDVRRRLAKARTLGKLSGRQLSSLAGMASNYSAMIERGASRHPAFWVVSRLACVLGVSLDWLARGEGEPPTREQVLSAVERARASKEADRAA